MKGKYFREKLLFLLGRLKRLESKSMFSKSKIEVLENEKSKENLDDLGVRKSKVKRFKLKVQDSNSKDKP